MIVLLDLILLVVRLTVLPALVLLRSVLVSLVNPHEHLPLMMNVNALLNKMSVLCAQRPANAINMSEE
jgi:hypothetical protein